MMRPGTSNAAVGHGKIGKPVFVGAVGGSGTRIVAAVLKAVGYHLGEDLNQELDNLWFTALFKRRSAWAIDAAELAELYEVFRWAMTGASPSLQIDHRQIEKAMLEPRPQHSLFWLYKRSTTLFSRLASPHRNPSWAWKEPNAHVVADAVLGVDPDVRYIHVARNGLDMAFSSNQNQLEFWGDLAIPGLQSTSDPASSLSYWCWAERRVQRLREQYPERVLWLRFEDICYQPETVARDLALFVDCDGAEILGQLKYIVRPPNSIGRFRQFAAHDFPDKELKFVTSLGFPVE